MRRMSDKQILKLITQLPQRANGDGDDLLRDMLCLIYPSKATQNS